jgi:hypothetical protein
MTEVQQETIDFTMMYATHNAFRRDLDRLIAAADAGVTGSPQIRAGWENFKKQLHLHHSVEDTYLWPRTARAAADRPRDLALLDEMQAEHDGLDPVLNDVDRALADPAAADLPGQARRLAATLGQHLSHEEEDALPLIQSLLGHADWRGFQSAMARAQGIKGAAVYIPWVADGASLPDRQRFLAKLPLPARLLNRLIWESSYRRRGLWNS